MSESLIIALLGALGGGGFLIGIIMLARFWKRDNAMTVKTETDAFKELREEAERAVEKSLKGEREKMKLENEISNRDLMLQIKDGIIERYELNFKDVHIEIGAVREKEKNCQQELALVKERLNVLEAK